MLGRKMADAQTYDIFIKEFLQNYDINLEKDDVGTKADQISRKIDETRNEFCKKLENKFTKLSETASKTDDLYRKVESLHEKTENDKCDMLQQIALVKELSPTGIEFLETKLEGINKILLILNCIKSLNSKLLALQTCLDKQQYLEATNALKSIKEIKNLSVEIFKYSKIKNEAKYLHVLNKMEEQLEEKLLNKLQELFAMKLPQISHEHSDDCKVKFCDQVDAKLWWEVIKSMQELDIWEPKIAKFSKKIYSELFEKVLVGDFEITEGRDTLWLEKSSKERKQSLSSARDVVVNIRTLTSFVGRGLRCSGNDEDACMESIGGHVSYDVIDKLRRNVIAAVIPDSMNDFPEFKILVDLAKDYQDCAQEFKFIPSDKDYVQTLIGDAEMTFVKKKCEGIITKTRTLLKEPLHVTIEIGEEKMGSFGETEDAVTPMKINLTPILSFPRCQISSSMSRIWQQVEELLTDLRGNEISKLMQVAAHLYGSIRKVLQLFMSIVPLYHRNDLQRLSLLPAIHHNNCMYMSYKSMQLETRLKEIFPSLPLASSFLDFSVTLRNMAVDSLKSFLSRQKDEIVEELLLQSGYENISNEAKLVRFNKCVDGVLLKLKHLNNIWSEVLPSMSQQLIGILLDSCLVKITRNIIQLEDISEADGRQFVVIIDRLESLGDELFPTHDPNGLPVVKCVESWTKLRELKFVLNARLMEIRDRWADGKGPLAEEFTSEEMDHLVRALFQNTDMRSVVLVAINSS